MMGVILLAAMLLAPSAWADSPDISARRLLSGWRDPDQSTRMLAEVIASALRGSLAGKEVYCPPPKGDQVMSALDRFLADHPDMADCGRRNRRRISFRSRPWPAARRIWLLPRADECGRPIRGRRGQDLDRLAIAARSLCSKGYLGSFDPFGTPPAKANPRLRPLHLVVRETEFCGLRLAGYFRRRMRENSRNSVRRPRCASLTRWNYGGFCLPGNRPGLSGLHGGARRNRTDGHRTLPLVRSESAAE